MPQLRVVQTDPLPTARTPPPAPGGPLTVVKSEPLALAGRAAPPPATPSASGRGGGPGNERIAAASPPPQPPFYPGGWKGAAQDFGGAMGGGLAAMAATAALPAELPIAGAGLVASKVLPKVIPFAGRVARGAATIAGAGVGGGAAAAATGSPLTAGGPNTTSADTEDSVIGAFARQAQMEALGLGAGWAIGAVGRRAIASTVAKKAKDWLEATRNVHMEDVQGILTRAQDALRAHATTGAATRAARTQTLAPIEDAALQGKLEATGATAAARATRESGKAQVDQLRGRWPTSEAELATPVRPMPGHTPGGPAARYKYTWPESFGGGHAYEVTDPAHALAGSDVSAATLAEHGIPVPSHLAATPPPPINFPARAAQKVAGVVEGPAQRSLDLLGQAVEGSAATGPALDVAPVKAKAQAMFAATQPGAAEGQVPGDVAGYLSNRTPAQIRDFMEKAGIPLEAEHPLPGVLGKLQDLPDALSFADAHKMKRLLDDAIGWKPAGAVKAPARTQLKQITKGVRGQIRATMTEAGHQPYESATAAYRDASTLFGPQGLARKIQAAAVANPEAIVNALVKVGEPTKLQMLKEVLTEHAARGGGEEGAAAGQEAWQQVQSTVIYKHLIQPGIDQFDASVAKMHPEFLHTLTGDPHARQVFERLRTMSDAVKDVQARTAGQASAFTGQAVAARGRQASAEAKASVLKQQGRAVDTQHAVEGQALQTERLAASRGVTEARQPTAAETAFAKSSLGHQPTPSAVGADAAYAVAAPMGSPRQIAGAARLVLRGPRVNDLIRWASLSPTGTQVFVRAVTSQAPGQAIAALIRLQDWMEAQGGIQPAVSHAPTKAATPPPAFAR